ncbi:C40 family peptidase [Prevotella sp. A2931]|uniref:C40 family peptidase n=1 Tax=Prevotella illustrans TaxID=2800387 RepID=A0ABS3M254_9BACT|nr:MULTISPECIES: NlpC/P60 family protein [Prevotella]MBO1362219.1 C40 family peptidase [Prevotella illustrans]PTL26508.1 peptidase [Prevotella sp. oral taxon 820]
MKHDVFLIRKARFFLALSTFLAINLTLHAQKPEAYKWAVVNVSVCNMRVAGDYDAGMETQGWLGEPVRILKDSMWIQVQTPDGDRAWVLGNSLRKMTREQLTRWNRSPQVVITTQYGFVRERPDSRSLPVGDLVRNNRLLLKGRKGLYYKVEYPDGRQGYVLRTDAMPLHRWRQSVKRDARSLIATAMQYNGIPYMWGANSTKGCDCSGFVSNVLLAHDIILPRNARQQALVGQHLGIAADFGNLIPGDLVFFGRKATDGQPARVSHVGLYIGNRKFIHSLGRVHVSSFNPADKEYDEYNLNRLLWATRVLPAVNNGGDIMTTENNDYFK